MATQPPLTILVDTPPEVINHTLVRGGNVQLAASLTEHELCELARLHSESSFAPIIGALIVSHPGVTEAVFHLVWETMGELSSVANAIATAGKAPNDILRELIKHRTESVREHAHLALVTRELDGAAPTRFTEILESHAGDEGVSLGIRHLLACHPRTPTDLLRQLAVDDTDFIADSAREQIRARGTNYPQSTSE